jgi:ribosome-binding factor A
MIISEKRPSHRPNRMADLIRETVASFLVNGGAKDPRIGFVTITQVTMTADLQIARVYYSAYGSDREKKETVFGLSESAGRIRTHLARTLSLRAVPRLEFFIDEGLEHSYRIQELLCGLEPVKTDETKEFSETSDSGHNA